MAKVLVAVEDYVGEGRAISHRFVHVRNLYYQRKSVDVTVLNFSADEDYYYEGIRVICLSSYEKSQEKYDVLICHQPNIKHHSLFLKKFGHEFPKFIFFFHGHEVLKINKAYSKPYAFAKSSIIKYFLQNIYDDFKLAFWRKYYLSVVEKSTFVFVSQWMLDEFLKWTKIPFEKIKKSYMITYNCIGQIFEDTTFEFSANKKFDFITIRNNLDGSKYCIDLVNDLAENNPDYRFLVIGKGEFFKHYSIAKNVEWKDQTMGHKEIVEHLQMARCALMPTRTDAQGLMMCEMASTGMPLITSELPVCHEVFDEFENIRFIDNEKGQVDLGGLLNDLENSGPYKKKEKYYNINTSQAEVELINKLICEG